VDWLNNVTFAQGLAFKAVCFASSDVTVLFFQRPFGFLMPANWHLVFYWNSFQKISENYVAMKGLPSTLTIYIAKNSLS